MKTEMWLLVLLVVAGCVICLNRYEVTVNPPIVAKLDRFTGQTWIAKGGQWMPIGDASVCLWRSMPSFQKKAH